MSHESIRESYDRSAAAYARYADRLVYRHLAAPLVQVANGADGPFLDVCSGTGALGRRLPRAVAADMSRGQLVHNPVAARVQADAAGLPFPDDAFAAALSAFGLNNVPDPASMVAEMVRVAPLVAVLTWKRPGEPFLPKEVVLRVVERHLGARRSAAGERIDRWTEAVGSEAAVHGLLEAAGLRAETRGVRVSVPWPGAGAFIEYRLSLLGVEAALGDPDAVRHEARVEIDALPPAALEWSARLVLGVGRRVGGDSRVAGHGGLQAGPHTAD